MSYLYKVIHNTVRSSHTWSKPDGYDTGILVYNCVAKKKVPLIVRNKNLVTWYTCGPTVYDSSHIGHASCFVKLDILQRILKNYFGLNLLTVMNITDVDDKIIKRSRELKVSESVLTQKYEAEFFEELNMLNIIKPNMILRVTEHMPQIKKFVKHLVDKKCAYIDKSGSVIFNIDLSNLYYGKLQNIRPKSDPNGSETPITNFTIWKSAKENEPFWDSDFGPGRPGWHTECSALASAVFGSTIDIHAGGRDLRFPHHENEEVQCCAAFSKSQWVNYWIHTGHLLQKSTKMSKSIKNTVDIRELLKSCSSDTFRMMCLMSHYRSDAEFSDEYVSTADNLLKTYKNFVSSCMACLQGKFKPQINGDILNNCLKDSVAHIRAAFVDDFDTDMCVKVINNLISTVNKMFSTAADDGNVELGDLGALVSALNFVVNTYNLLGIELQKESLNAGSTDLSTELMNILIEYRQNVRILAIENKHGGLLNLCDDVRNNLSKIGIVVKDHGKVSSWSKN